MSPIIIVILALLVYALFAYLRRETRATPKQEADALREADERLAEIDRHSDPRSGT